MEAMHIISMHNIVKKYYVGKPNELEILHGIDLEVEEGEFLSIIGPSGAGKSTLMNLIGVLDRPTSGTYTLGDISVEKCKDQELSAIRNRKIGFVFQNFNLLPRVSALDNVSLPMMYAGVGRKERSRRAAELLEKVGMGERASHQPNELSGGQQQRVAIARAIANDPDIILADEPTGALDSRTGQAVMDLFQRLHEEDGKTIILITHNPDLAAQTGRILTIEDGRIVKEETR
ncbi:MAG: ABC transporter ATP-binding protein [Eubacteriales bacterium]|nr:ABC transporter ATP-binding protein [Eubacteriales bacterium]